MAIPFRTGSGAVIAKDGCMDWRDIMKNNGEPHAEKKCAGFPVLSLLKGATLYIFTLEPCCHHGKLPPCIAEAILQVGISRVVTGSGDPNSWREERNPNLERSRDTGKRACDEREM